jgi:gliding motility-associated-like protein
MKKKLLLVFASFAFTFCFSQECPDLLAPVNGAINVPVNTTITWEAVDGVPAYRIRLGTSPGGREIAEATAGTNTFYTPAFTLPENTVIYVTIILDFLFLDSEDIICESQSFRTEDVTDPPFCSQFINPQNGSNDLSILTSLNWTYAPTATGYYLSIGTTQGGNEILNNVDVGNNLSYTPVNPFPENTTIYLLVIPYNENGSATGCLAISFTTGELPPLPLCTQLVSPLNGTSNVPLDTVLEWDAVEGADGYRITVGSNPNSADIIDDLAIFNTQTNVFDFEPNKTYFITIVPFNDAGGAISCSEESFSTAIGCVYTDANNNTNVDLRPLLEFPSVFSFCGNNNTLSLVGPVGADGYRWYYVNDTGQEVLISESSSFNIQETGNYILESYNLITQFAEVIECAIYNEFSVVDSEPPVISNFIERETNFGIEITVEVEGNGNYEYAIDKEDGPYQDSNVFSGIDSGVHTFFVRDKNGCGIVSKRYGPDLILEGFPKFFTPNGDSANDFWQFTLPPNSKEIELRSIQIFNRYGVLVSEMNPDSKGWDGTYLGKPIPAGGLWFKAIDENDKIYSGYFTLKR